MASNTKRTVGSCVDGHRKEGHTREKKVNSQLGRKLTTVDSALTRKDLAFPSSSRLMKWYPIPLRPFLPSHWATTLSVRPGLHYLLFSLLSGPTSERIALRFWLGLPRKNKPSSILQPFRTQKTSHTPLTWTFPPLLDVMLICDTIVLVHESSEVNQFQGGKWLNFCVVYNTCVCRSTKLTL